MLANSRMLSRRNIIIAAAFTLFALTLLLTSQRLASGPCPGPFCTDYTAPAGKPQPQSQQHEGDLLQTASGGAPVVPVHTPTSSPAAHAAPSSGSESGASKGSTKTGEKSKVKPGCEDFPDMSNIFVVLKTGASESYNRLPTQLMTNLKCVPNYEIWSDMEQDIAGQHVFDALTEVLPDIKAHADFEIYHHQAYCPIDQEHCNKGYDTAKKGWDLDKYKNIHIAENNWSKHSNFDWYFYIDADTYVSWPTLVEWFKKLDPTKPSYFGSVAMLGDFPFGHGGSGYVVSKAGMKKMFDGKKNVGNKYDHKATTTCCGDYLFAFAIKEEAGLDVQQMFPTINGERPYTMPYYDNHWCQPIITVHHVVSEEIDELDAFERLRGFKSPVLIKDIFHSIVEPKLKDSHDNWDNMSFDTYYFDPLSRQFDSNENTHRKDGEYTEDEKQAHLSFDHCRKACEMQDKCMQFNYGKGICGLSTAVRFGNPAQVNDKDSYWNMKAGWMVERIKKWAKDHDNCGPVKFPTVKGQ